jgi:hypothetical protein
MKAQSSARSILFVLLIGGIGASLALQGWKERLLTFDLLPYVEGVEQLREAGSIPRSGTLTSFGSYTPPGTTWLLLPGMLVFQDTRLFQSIGSSLLYLGTLVGIFLLTRACLGNSCALLATALWGISASGLWFAHSLWPRGHPFFFVWMVYWTVQWVKKNNPYFLGAALFTWAVGIYVFLEIAPAIVVVPAAWLLCRPTLRVGPILLAVTLSAIVWFPYLRFESGRHFIDLKSQLLRHQIYPANYKQSWCDPGLATGSWQEIWNPAPPEAQHDPTALATLRLLVARIRGRGNLILNSLLLSNFQYRSLIPGSGVGLFAMTLLGLSTLFASTLTRADSPAANQSWINRLKRIGIAALLAGVMFNEKFVAYGTADGILESSNVLILRCCQAILLGGGILLIACRQRLVSVLARLAPDEPRDAQGARLLAVALSVSWFLMLVVTGVDRLERFWWLWPLQVIAFASFVTYLPMRLKAPRWITWAGTLAIILVVAANSLLASRLHGWFTDGWPGTDAPEIQLSDYVANLVSTRGERQASIGYELYVYHFMAMLHKTDPLYKVGAQLDTVFKYHHGIVNTNKCAEGVSQEDQYRIVQPSAEGIDDPAARVRIDAQRDSLFRMTRAFGPYQVFQRP